MVCDLAQISSCSLCYNPVIDLDELKRQITDIPSTIVCKDNCLIKLKSGGYENVVDIFSPDEQYNAHDG